ncbi:fumarylacetoacetate hydrolase family protein [Rosistilla oblonga]|uniref:fumarylacetoacetate hydrolase family protein n=1 Tax=Rosistilla oblonga TaxID=2527990 RepID=UPI003A975351
MVGAAPSLPYPAAILFERSFVPMRYCRFEIDNVVQLGLFAGDRITPVAGIDATLPSTMPELMATQDLDARLAKADAAESIAVDSVKILAPVAAPEKVICIGLNYRDHAIETNSPIPESPVVFCKFPSSVVGPGDPIILPTVSDSVDYEAELVIVIGKTAHNVSVDEAMDCVFGYTCGHDVSARDWQKGTPGGQWLLGKTFDTFAPIGPVIVDKSELSDPGNLSVKMHVSGETLQDGTTRELIFSIPELIAHLTQIATLRPGDLIFTGTPPGVGAARTPKRFLKPGDSCTVEIEGIGSLTNPCVAADSDEAKSFRAQRFA